MATNSLSNPILSNEQTEKKELTENVIKKFTYDRIDTDCWVAAYINRLFQMNIEHSDKNQYW